MKKSFLASLRITLQFNRLYQSAQHQNLDSFLKEFSKHSSIFRKTDAFGIDRDLVKSALESFISKSHAGEIPNVNFDLLYQRHRSGEDFKRLLTLEFLKHVTSLAPEQSQYLASSMTTLDMRDPFALYSGNINVKRKIIFHAGPTNSGKTYHALNALKVAESGVYCGPLRLLAHEIYERFNQEGIKCNLVTGEDVRSDESILKFACTIEMVPRLHQFDVAIIDEIQMISDSDRGWAWTQALLTIRAKELHVCGEPSAIDLVKRLCKGLGEEVEVREYTRLTDLHVQEESLNGDESKVVKGDCFVTFSRKDIFYQKGVIEKKTGLKCAVIYGSLPPESRSEQASLFNDPKSNYDVLVASDAVGMGLNLNIRRVIFSTIRKFNGTAQVPLATTQIKQIGGRAGRYNTEHPEGFVTTLFGADLGAVTNAMKANFMPIKRAGLGPSFEMIESFSLELPKEPLSQLFDKFQDLAQTSSSFFICDFRSQKMIADIIEKFDLPLDVKFIFCNSPAAVGDPKNPLPDICTYQFAKAKAGKYVARIDDFIKIPEQPPKTIVALKKLEVQHKVILHYLWLSYRFSETFADVASAIILKQRLEQLIKDGLKDVEMRGASASRGAFYGKTRPNAMLDGSIKYALKRRIGGGEFRIKNGVEEKKDVRKDKREPPINY